MSITTVRDVTPPSRVALHRRASAAVFVSIALLSSCNGLFYYPDACIYSVPASMPAAVDDVMFPSRDGTRLHGWFLHARGERVGTVVYFHGNAQNLTSHVHFVEWLPARGFDVFVFDYRGYGKSAGVPSRAGVHLDGLAALAYVRSRGDVVRDRLLVFGQSLGGAVAVAALGDGGNEGVRGIAVDSTFASYIGMGNEVLGGTFLTWPFAWLLLSDAHSPVDAIANLAPMPLLVFASARDPVVPIGQGRALFAAAGEPKEFVEVPAYGHPIATEAPASRERLVEFFTACVGAR